jgi:Fe-S cluster assembly protein SufD
VSAKAEAVSRGVGRASLDTFLARFGEGSISSQARYDALSRYEELPVRVAIRGGRTWKQDLEKLDLTDLAVGDDDAVEFGLEPSPGARRSGVTIERFSLARERHRDTFERAFGRAVDTRDDKFASLALAFARTGLFIDVPEGVVLDEPLEAGFEGRGSAVFPYTLVSLGAGARATLIERVRSDAGTPLVCGIVEIILAERAHLTYAVDQRAAATTRLIVTRRAILAADAQLEIACAELGGLHAVSRVRAVEHAPGARVQTVALFFSDGAQHVDLESETIHAAGNTQSQTIVRSAGTDRGQGRYIGNIKILADAHGADASLRDDALLLSPGAHIDSVPALEIAANDVRAFHGATVGAISEEELFYAQTRGIPRAEAERMIALGFFEPAVSRFPTEALRDELRRALENKLGPRAV